MNRMLGSVTARFSLLNALSASTRPTQSVAISPQRSSIAWIEASTPASCPAQLGGARPDKSLLNVVRMRLQWTASLPEGPPAPLVRNAAFLIESPVSSAKITGLATGGEPG